MTLVVATQTDYLNPIQQRYGKQKSKIKLTKQKLTVANLSYMHNFEFVDAMLALTTVSTSSLPAPQQLDLDLTQLVI